MLLRRRRRRNRADAKCGVEIDHELVLRGDRRKARKRRYDHRQHDQ